MTRIPVIAQRKSIQIRYYTWPDRELPDGWFYWTEPLCSDSISTYFCRAIVPRGKRRCENPAHYAQRKGREWVEVLCTVHYRKETE